MTVATLGLAVNSGPVTQAVPALNQLTQAAQQAQNATQQLAGATNANASAQASAAAASKMHAVALQSNATAARMMAMQQRNLVYQLNDVVVSLASGMSLQMVALQQGSQILQNGVGNAVKSLIGLAGNLVTKFWPVAAVVAVVSAGIAGITREINKTAETQVSFVDTFIAGMELAAEAIGRAFGPAIKQIGTWLGELWDWMSPMLKMLGNGLVGIMVGAYNTVVKTWELLPDAFASLFIKAMNGAISIVQNGINGIIGALRKLPGLDGLQDADLSAFLGKPSDADQRIGQVAGKEFGSAMNTDWLGEAGAAWSKRAQEVANRPSAEEMKKLQKEAERQAKAYAEITRSAQQRIDQSHLEVQTLGMTREAAAALRHEQELLAKAANDNIKLSPRQRAELSTLAKAMAAAEEAAKSLTEIYEFGKETFNSFFSDFNQGLKEGATLWESLGEAGLNALSKIADKALSMAADGLFDLIFGAIKGSLFGGGFSPFGGSAITPSTGLMPTFAGGGYTGPGARVGGLDGMGGFPAMLHPNETIVDHTQSARSSMQNARNDNGPSIVMHNTINANSEAEGAAAARGFSKELDRLLPAAMERYNRNPYRRTG